MVWCIKELVSHLNPRPHPLFRHPRPHLGEGLPPTARLPPNWNRASQQRQAERSRCSESNHTRFYYLRSNFDLPRAGQTKNVAFLGRSSFWRITFELRKIEKNAKHHRIPLVKTHRNMYLLTPKGQFENLTLGQVKWPDLINDPGRSYCMSFDASWRD